MFQNLFRELKRVRVPVSLPEYLDLMGAMDKGVAEYSVDDFYYLSRAVLVKDERHLDRFDQIFGHVFKGLERVSANDEQVEIPQEWLKRLAELHLTEEEMAKVEFMGANDSLNRKAAMKAAASGLAPLEPRPLVLMALIRKVCASANIRDARAAR